jgi:hypothetical protein
MKKMIGKARQTMQQYWSKVMHSTRVRMPIGAQFISKMIAWARGENWRGKRENKK